MAEFWIRWTRKTIRPSTTILPPTYLLGSLVLAAALWLFLSGPQILPSPWNLIGIGHVLVGVGFNAIGDRQFQRAKTTMNPFGQPRVLVTTGVFRYSRHPMYAGLVLIVLGISVLFGYATPFAAPALLWAVLHYRSSRKRSEGCVRVLDRSTATTELE